MLLELAIGDAYGAAFEYVSRRMVREQNDLARYYAHPRHAIGRGYYTDDTQMSLAVAEALLDDRAWSAELLAEHFVRAFKRDPREGYAGGFFQFLCDVADHEQFLRDIRPESDKSGAAMRTCPIGVLPTIEQVTDRCRLQAAITHNTPGGINAAVAAALATHYCVYGLGRKCDLQTFVADHVDGDWTTPWKGKVGAKGWMSVRAAFTAISEHDSLSGLLKACIDFEGDVDTVATIALGIASCSSEVENDLPVHLIDGLENDEYGRDYIVALDERLMGLAEARDNSG